MTIIYTIIAFFIAWIWVDYFRLIDIFRKDSLLKLIIIFFGGAVSVFLVYGYLGIGLPKYYTEVNGNPLHDIIFCIFGIGLIEELAKILPVLIGIRFFKLNASEPIDLLAFFCVSALGFSAVENVGYFLKSGPDVITSRAVLSTIGHMFDTSIFGYGIVRFKFFHYSTKRSVIWLFLLLASISHGLYDFIVLSIPDPYNIYVLLIYFLITISIFSTILNNAINNSAYFNYSKIIDSTFVAKRLLFYYLIIYLLEFALNAYEDSLKAFIKLIFKMFIPGIILLITVIRLSRFKLIRNRWNPIRLELPFKFVSEYDHQGNLRTYISIRGDSYNETLLNSYYQEYFILIPVHEEGSFLEGERAAYIEEKLFLKNDETFYLTSVFADIENRISFSYLIQPKTFGTSFMYGKYPIVALLKYDNGFDMNDNSKSRSDFEFIEWAYIKPRQYFR